MLRMEALTGFSSSKVMDFSFYDLIHAQDIRTIERSFKNCKNSMNVK